MNRASIIKLFYGKAKYLMSNVSVRVLFLMA